MPQRSNLNPPGFHPLRAASWESLASLNCAPGPRGQPWKSLDRQESARWSSHLLLCQSRWVSLSNPFFIQKAGRARAWPPGFCPQFGQKHWITVERGPPAPCRWASGTPHLPALGPGTSRSIPPCLARCTSSKQTFKKLRKQRKQTEPGVPKMSAVWPLVSQGSRGSAQSSPGLHFTPAGPALLAWPHGHSSSSHRQPGSAS